MDKDLKMINDIKEELPIRWGQEEPAEFLQNFIAKLKYLNTLLSKNTYIKETTKILKYIIQDASNSTMVLLAGMTGSGKTTLVNALLKRTIFSSMEVTTEVNTIICYGEKEEVRAHFLDGQVATFDIDKVEVFTALDTSSARLLREGLDFIEIFIKNDLLKMVTLIDTTPIQISGNQAAYMKESILNRADDIFWIFKYGMPINQAELKLLNKLKEKNIIPLGLLNGLDLMESNDKDIISKYEEQVSDNVRDLICISAKEALESLSLEDHDEKWSNSQIDLVLKELEKTANNQAERLMYLTERFIHWLKRFQTEIEIISEREPYQSSRLIVKDFVEHVEDRKVREAAQNKSLMELTEQYKKLSSVFRKVDTLYQLIQVLDAKLFSDCRELFIFNEQAKKYLMMIREYRKLYQEYHNLYEIVDKKHQKINGMKLLKYIFGKQNEDEYFIDKIGKLNDQQQVLFRKYHLLKVAEEKLFQSFEKIKNLINQIVLDKLASILKDCSTIKFQRNTENTQIRNAIVKLHGFDSIVEAKKFIVKFVNDFVLKEDLILTIKEKTKLEETLKAIENVVFDYQTYIQQYEQIKDVSNEKILSSLVDENPFGPCELTEDKISIEIEEPPILLNIK